MTRLAASALLACALLAGCASDADPAPPRATPTGATATTGEATPVRVVAVGDIVCDPDTERTPQTCRHRATSALTLRLDPDVVLGLGDLQYEDARAEAFRRSWAPTWGRLDDRMLPAPGNHEYYSEGAEPYLRYFGVEPYYVEEVGAWRVYLLNSNCDVIDCQEQAAWFRADLRAHPARCQAIVMHHSRISSGYHGPNEMVQPLWEVAVDERVDIAMSGHDHDYERFTRLGVDGQPTDVGVRQFVVGTGGRSLYSFERDPLPGSEASDDSVFGVLELDLRPTGYGWRFVTIDDREIDSGDDTCR